MLQASIITNECCIFLPFIQIAKKSCVDIFKSRGHQVEVAPTRPEAELVQAIGDYDALIVRSATKVEHQRAQCSTDLLTWCAFR